MLLAILSAVTLPAAPLPETSRSETPLPDVSAEYQGRFWKDGAEIFYERYDIRFTNEAEQPQALRMCPRDASLRYKMDRVYRLEARAIGVDGKGWNHNCIDRDLAAGDSVELSIFFPLSNRLNVARPVTLATSLGNFQIVNEQVVLVASAGKHEADPQDS